MRSTSCARVVPLCVSTAARWSMRHCPQRLLGGWVCEYHRRRRIGLTNLYKTDKREREREKYALLTRLAFSTFAFGLLRAFFFAFSFLVAREFFALSSPASAAGPDSSDTFPSEFR